ncbi:MAG TPA: ECF transporter S component [Acetivibrio sp.]|uniref:ECF transporter S component n=1 Tax=Acetivibrio sp. TaxID=1872092 RepID=UPI002B8FBE43|nr:ECF transporter S component [Acetivibrio sp.]HOM02339.1 ECF transporter S component [Acetivibrio sp.]
MNNNYKLKYFTRTAMLLALTIVFQSLGRRIPLGQNSNFIVGPLVNACLIISSALVGLLSGAVISVLAPYGAILTGATMPLPLAPFVALGNFVLVLAFYIFRKKKVIGIILGSIAKFAVIYGSLLYIIPFFKLLPKNKAMALAGAAFGWPQLVTALIGGIIAIPIIYRLERHI